MNPVEAPDEYMKAFKQLMDLEQLAHLAAQAGDRRADAVSLLDPVRRRFARPPEPVRAPSASPDPDERVLAWGALTRDEGWLVATSRGLRVVPAAGHGVADAEVLPWHEVGTATWSAAADDGRHVRASSRWPRSSRACRRGSRRSATSLTDAGDLPAVVRRRVDQTVVTSQRSPLPGRGGVLLVARRIPGQAGARVDRRLRRRRRPRTTRRRARSARQKLAELVAADQPD